MGVADAVDDDTAVDAVGALFVEVMGLVFPNCKSSKFRDISEARVDRSMEPRRPPPPPPRGQSYSSSSPYIVRSIPPAAIKAISMILHTGCVSFCVFLVAGAGCALLVVLGFFLCCWFEGGAGGTTSASLLGVFIVYSSTGD